MAVSWETTSRASPVITGLGIISPIGIGAEPFWRAALTGESGIGLSSLVETQDLPIPCRITGEVKGFLSDDWMTNLDANKAGRFSQFASAATQLAIRDSGFVPESVPAEQLLVALGTSMNGTVDVHQSSFTAFLEGKEVVPWTVLEYPAHAATSHVAIALGARGQTASFATACAAGLDAIVWAAEQVASGSATAVFAGGFDTPLSAYSLLAFYNAGVLSRWDGDPREASRPFERRRSGLVLAEGGAIVIVEDEAHAVARKAKIYARILGHGAAGEGRHLRKVDTSGTTAAYAMRQAVDSARLSPDGIDYINAHGNSMVDYDLSETNAIKATFGQHAYSIPISSLKGMCGQALAGSGPMQVVAACLAIRDRLVPPTINYVDADPACDLDYVPNVSRRVRIRNILLHAHSMGGSHTAIILGTPN